MDARRTVCPPAMPRDLLGHLWLRARTIEVAAQLSWDQQPAAGPMLWTIGYQN